MGTGSAGAGVLLLPVELVLLAWTVPAGAGETGACSLSRVTSILLGNTLKMKIRPMRVMRLMLI